ncbi:MAG TPA: hypothetical protein VHC48_24620, partial [Puia sp.]|nr:hypothetical protein [Puia sp.]
MNKALFFLMLLFSFLLSNAQLTPEQQKKMQEAQQKLKQLQNNPEVQKVQQQINKIKTDTSIAARLQQAGDSLKNHPEAGNITVPNLNTMNVGMPNMDSLNASISLRMKNAQNNMAALQKLKEQYVPKADPSHHAEALAKLQKAAVIAFTHATLNNVSPKLDIILKSNLDKVVKDSTLNASGTGLFYLSLDLSPKEASAYLICKGILLHSGDPYAINALGVYCRSVNDVENALKLFFYADGLLPDSAKSPYIYANIGWASLYYGDFSAAQKYFDKSLAISSAFKPALEGNAMVAYAKGDIKGLFQCLARELLAMTKYAGGEAGGNTSQKGSDDGPSESFADIAASENIQSVKDLEQQPDPTQDKSFDNFSDEEPDNGASDGGEDVSFEPESKPIFSVAPKTLPQAKAAAAKFVQKAISIMQPFVQGLIQQMSGLKPLAATTTIDNNGTVTVSKSYRKWVDIAAEVHRLFDRRIYWYRKKYLDKYAPFPKQWQVAMTDKVNQFMKDIESCGIQYKCEGMKDPALGRCLQQREKCINEAKCKWLPVLYGECNSDIESAARIWNDYWDNISKTIQWYINATNPLFKRVHDAGWNSYLNYERTIYIKRTVLTAYSDWASEVLIIPIDPFAGEDPPSCPVEIAGINPPDPFSKKPKHLKEFVDDRFCETWSSPLGIETDNCHYTKWKVPFIGLTHTENTDQAYAQKQGYTSSWGFDGKVDIPLGEIAKVSIGSGKEWKYDEDGKLVGTSVTKTTGASIGAKGDLVSAGVGGKYTTVSNYDANGNPTGSSATYMANGSLGLGG